MYVSKVTSPGTVTRRTTMQPFPVALNVKVAITPADVTSGKGGNVKQATPSSPGAGGELVQNAPESNKPLALVMLVRLAPALTLVPTWRL